MATTRQIIVVTAVIATGIAYRRWGRPLWHAFIDRCWRAYYRRWPRKQDVVNGASGSQALSSGDQPSHRLLEPDVQRQADTGRSE